MKVFLEGQWQEQRGQIVLTATDNFGGDRYAVTIKVETAAEANKAWRDWQSLYRDAGAEVVT